MTTLSDISEKLGEMTAHAISNKEDLQEIKKFNKEEAMTKDKMHDHEKKEIFMNKWLFGVLVGILGIFTTVGSYFFFEIEKQKIAQTSVRIEMAETNQNIKSVNSKLDRIGEYLCIGIDIRDCENEVVIEDISFID